MLRYMVFAWNAGCPTQRGAANALIDHLHQQDRRWRLAMQATGCKVFVEAVTAGNAIHLLHGHHGIVVGSLLKGDRIVGPMIEAAEADALLRTEGRHLVSAYWGSYVAILSDQDKKTTWVLRSPMGTLNCLTCQLDGVQLYASHFADFVGLRLIKLSLSWQFIARSFAKLTEAHETGLNEVNGIGSGECSELRDGRALRKLYWDPLSIARSDVIRNETDAIDAMRTITRSSVNALASPHTSVLLQLSGGLDSSIVLGCLASAPTHPRITGVIRYSPDSDGDERAFARAAAKRAGCHLVELPRDPGFQVDAVLQAQPTEKPQSYLQYVGQGKALLTLAQEMGQTAIISGSGGDEIFFNAEPQRTVADYLHDRGLRPGLLDATLTASRLEGLSVWRVLREALKEGWGRHPWSPVERLRAERGVINWNRTEHVRQRTGHQPSWFAPDRYVPPGKQLQIALIARHGAAPCSPAFIDRTDPELLRPLLSQPLVELVLRIPTYLLISGGWDRAIARRAFAQDVPTEIIRRRWKGRQEAYTAEVVGRNLDFVRSVVLDGRLVSEGFIDRTRMSAALSGGPSGAVEGMRPISKCFALEVWLRILAANGIHIGSSEPRSTPLDTEQFAEA